MANHPLYHVFTDVGFRGRFQVLDRNQTKYHIKIWQGDEAPADDGSMEVLWTTTSELGAWTGSFVLTEKHYSARFGVVRLAPDRSNPEFQAIWLLDAEPTPLHEPLR